MIPSGTRRTVAGRSKDSGITLDDAPFSILPMRDQKRLLVCLPHDLWIIRVDGAELSYAQNIELDAPAPSVSEAEKGELWIGGKHLRRGSAFDLSVSKFGSKLGGYVDDVALLRPGLLCGVGHQGEVLLDLERGEVLHRRKAKGSRARSVCASADERAIFTDESSSAWVIDPAHPGGYTKLRFEGTHSADLPEEAIVRVSVDHKGRCLLAAKDGAVAWTTASLRRAGECWNKLPAAECEPLSIASDDDWLYVLRPRGRFQRFNLRRDLPPKKGKGRKPDEDEAPPLPAAQECRLERAATCMAILRQEEGSRVVFGGAQSQGMLGRLWTTSAEQLEWHELKLGDRPEREAPDSNHPAPNFEKIRNKLPEDAKSLAQVDVDEVVGGLRGYWVVQSSGTLLERPVAPMPLDELLPGDALLLPAMLRPKQGTARPGLLLWPGLPNDRDGDPPAALWLCWGDDPRGWMPMLTPEIRAQRWKRSDLFPMQVAIRKLPDAPGRRERLPKNWVDPELFEALAKECKKLLKVLW